jgi:hypothetical protein
MVHDLKLKGIQEDIFPLLVSAASYPQFGNVVQSAAVFDLRFVAQSVIDLT